jgi:uncharacterized protein (TIGR02996 family)
MIRELDLDALAAAWERGDEPALTDGARALGVALPLAAAQALGARLRNHLTRKDVLLTIQQALADESGIALREVRNQVAHDWRSGKELCLAVRRGDQLTVGVRSLPNLPSPVSEAWPELKPWYQELGRNQKRAQAWARQRREDRVTLALVARAAPAAARAPDELEAELRRAVVAAPADDAPRLVYADWLLERGDARGELIRLQCDLAALHKKDPRRAELEPRAARLVEDFGARFAGSVAEHADDYQLARGFVSSVTMTAGGFRKHGGRLFREHPIDELRLRPVNEESLAKLAACPDLALVRRLSLGPGDLRRMRYVQLAGLAGCRYLDGLEHLDLSMYVTDPMDWERFLDGLVAPQLRSIDFAWACVSPRCLRSIARNRYLPRLEELSLEQVSALSDLRRANRSDVRVPPELLHPEESADALVDQAFELLADSPTVRALQRLRLGWYVIESAHVARLVAGANAERLTLLNLNGCRRVDDDGLRAIAASARLGALELLDVSFTRMTEAGAEALLASPHLSSLRTLWIWNTFQPEVAQRIAARLLAVPRSRALAEVMWDPQLPPETHAALAARYKVYRHGDG